jgi:hypothetical protein
VSLYQVLPAVDVILGDGCGLNIIFIQYVMRWLSGFLSL